MKLNQKELEVNAALQKTGIEKYTKAMQDLADLLHVPLDLHSSRHGGEQLQCALGAIIADLYKLKDEHRMLVTSNGMDILNDGEWKIYLDDNPCVTFDYRYGLGTGNCWILFYRPRFTLSDFWMNNTADTIVEDIADKLRMVNILIGVVIRYRTIKACCEKQDDIESSARAEKAMAQLELLRRL